jgi:hypothetical protein
MLFNKYLFNILEIIIKQNNETVVINILFEHHRHLSPFEGLLGLGIGSTIILPQHTYSIGI